MDETYIKVKGIWKYLYRAVDKEGKTVDFLLTAKRDKAAALRFFDKAMQSNGVPEKVGLLLWQSARLHAVANDALVALNGQLDPTAQAVVILPLPGDPTVRCNGSNMLVALGVACL